MKSARSLLTASLLCALWVVPAAAAFAHEGAAIAVLRSSPYAHQNYGTNVVRGRAELTSEGGVAAARTKVVVRLSGLKPGTAHIGHIHGGSCAALAAGTILHNLEVVVANNAGEGTSKTEIAQGLQGFTDCSWWVAFHEGAENAVPQTPAIAVGPVIVPSRE